MQKILVISEGTRTGEAIKRTIERSLPYIVTTVYDLQGAKAQLDGKVYNVVILDHQSVDENVINRVDWLSRSNSSLPIILFSEKIEEADLNNFAKFQMLHVLIRPTSDKNLIALVKKIVAVKTVPKQRFRRYNTDQVAVFDSSAAGERIQAKMFNLSKGGAYCEFAEGQSLPVGGRYRMRVIVPDTKRVYTFEAQVVWATSKGKFSGKAGCGIKFLNAASNNPRSR